jgi:phenylacetate-CoA ligase
VEAVFTSSEALFPHQREIIEQAFECKVFDFYGLAERVAFATECTAHCGIHLNMDFGITEILNMDHEPVGHGEMGKIVATGLHNFAMPLIRYETNDVTVIQGQKCTCGRESPLIGDLTARAEDIITTRDGRYISFASLTLPIKLIGNVGESQIIQEDLEHIRVRIVKRPDYRESDTQDLLAEFRKRIGTDVKVEIEFVDSIPRSRTGKFRFVISKVPLKL